MLVRMHRYSHPMYLAPGTVGALPETTSATPEQCQAAYYHGAQAAATGLTADQGLVTLATLFPEGVMDPTACVGGSCGLEEMKRCYRLGFDETKNPPSFYKTDNGKKGLVWGVLGGLAAGIGGVLAYQKYAPKA
jgi:hypothetical protein